MTSELTEFMEAADEMTAQWLGTVRIDHPDAVHSQNALFVTNNEDFERQGIVLVAFASGDTRLDSVAVSVHAFRDGQRITPHVLDVAGEVIITIDKNA